MHKFKLGTRLICKVTGFTGIAVSRLEYVNGCIQYGLKQKMDTKPEAKYPENIYIDEEQLDYVDEGIHIVKKEGGGPETIIRQSM